MLNKLKKLKQNCKKTVKTADNKDEQAQMSRKTNARTKNFETKKVKMQFGRKKNVTKKQLKTAPKIRTGEMMSMWKRTS